MERKDKSDIEITLLDSLNKRINFLNSVSEQTGLPMNCVHMRAEDGGRDVNLREKFDIATARAVAPLNVLCEYCIPFVKTGGEFVALKGPSEDYQHAKSAIRILGGEISSVNEYALPNGDMRSIIIIKKIKSTTAKFPRNSGQIKKLPL